MDFNKQYDTTKLVYAKDLASPDGQKFQLRGEVFNNDNVRSLHADTGIEHYHTLSLLYSHNSTGGDKVMRPFSVDFGLRGLRSNLAPCLWNIVGTNWSDNTG